MKATFPGVEFLRALYLCSNREGKICCSMSTSSIKRCSGRFCIIVVQWTSKKCTKKCDAHAEQLFCSQNQLFFDVVDIIVIVP